MAASYFDGLPSFALISMANDIGESLIHGTNNGAGFFFGEMKELGGAFDGGTHKSQRLRVALQLQLQEQLRMERAFSA